ncbi:MAG TPA: VOC family protein [Caulobacteraceae bacterium]|nr:VOC family protein [Caulobacteraceae bacterium]
MEVNGVAHVFITAGDFPRVRAFYRQLLPFLGLKPVMDAGGTYYCVGGRTGFGVRARPAGGAPERFDQSRVGLHHVCFRVREREEVEEAHAFLVSIGTAIVHPPQDDEWAPGYYSVLFEDPDGVRLEINHVPGQGLLAPGGYGHLGGSWPTGT